MTSAARASPTAKVENTLQVLVDSLLRGLDRRATPTLRAQIKQEGLDFDSLPDVMPIEDWVRHRRRIGALAFPEAEQPEAMRLLGLHFIRGWRNTAIGAATSAVLSLLGPVRTLTRLERAFRTTDCSIRTAVEFVGVHEALLTLDDVRGDPTYWIGVIEGGLELLRRTGTVAIHAHAPPGVILRITWS